MQTPSHFLMAAALQYPLRGRGVPVNRAGLLFGSILPDLSLAILSLAYSAYYRWTDAHFPAESLMDHLHNLYFTGPVWVVGHNFFHSLVIGAVLLAIGWLRFQRSKRTFLFWLAASTLLHTTIDIFTHTSDGPLFLFPLSWTYRFASPVSYWESGMWFVALEYAFDALLLVFIGRHWLAQRATQGQQYVST